MLHEPTSRLVAVMIKAVLPAHFAPPYGNCTPYLLSTQSFDKDAVFTFETAPMPSQYARAYEALREHGFTVVELPPDWFKRFGDPVTWQSSIITDALRNVSHAKQLKERRVPGPTYKEMARTVLVVLEEVFPKEMSNLELKHLIQPEPTDAEILEVLDGLHHQGFIDGKGLQDYTTGQRSYLS